MRLNHEGGNQEGSGATIPEDDIEVINSELEYIVSVVNSINEGGEYADTGSSIEMIDDMLGQLPQYQELKELRREASMKIMQEDESEKVDGIRIFNDWAEKVRNLVSSN